MGYFPIVLGGFCSRKNGTLLGFAMLEFCVFRRILFHLRSLLEEGCKRESTGLYFVSILNRLLYFLRRIKTFLDSHQITL